MVPCILIFAFFTVLWGNESDRGIRQYNYLPSDVIMIFFPLQPNIVIKAWPPIMVFHLVMPHNHVILTFGSMFDLKSVVCTLSQRKQPPSGVQNTVIIVNIKEILDISHKMTRDLSDDKE